MPERASSSSIVDTISRPRPATVEIFNHDTWEIQVWHKVLIRGRDLVTFLLQEVGDLDLVESGYVRRCGREGLQHIGRLPLPGKPFLFW